MSDLSIKHPWITEKATRLAESGKYVFKVAPNATKSEVKKAVKEIYKVDVVSVNITTKPPRQVRFRGKRAVKKGHKKAVVTLKSGQKIDLA